MRKEDLIGTTWQFNDTPVISSLFANKKYIFDIRLECEDFSSDFLLVEKEANPGRIIDISTNFGAIYNGTRNEQCKVFTILDTKNLVEEQVFIDFLTTNATRVKSVSLQNLKVFKEECDKLYKGASSESIFDVTPYMTSLTSMSVEGYNKLSQALLDNKVSLVKLKGDSTTQDTMLVPMAMSDTSISLLLLTAFDNSKNDIGVSDYLIHSDGSIVARSNLCNFAIGNPLNQTATEELKTIQIGATTYSISSGGGDTLLGTWLLNNTIDLSTAKSFDITFASNKTTFNKLEVKQRHVDTLNALYFDATTIFEIEHGSGLPTWANENYKIISITDTSKLTNKSDLETWLNSNASKLSMSDLDLIIINQPSTATNGTIEESYRKSIGKINSIILFNNEYYTLQDKEHTSGFVTYSHVGYENGTHILKTITITLANNSWNLSTTKIDGGSSLYVCEVRLTDVNMKQKIRVSLFQFYTSDKTINKTNLVDKLRRRQDQSLSGELPLFVNGYYLDTNLSKHLFTAISVTAQVISFLTTSTEISNMESTNYLEFAPDLVIDVYYSKI